MTGFEPAPTMHRLAFVLVPDAACAVEFAGLANSLRAAENLGGEAIEAGRLHLTLFKLGDHAEIPQDLIRSASAAASMVASSPFAITLDRVASFSEKRRNRPLVLLASNVEDSLLDLRHRLGAGLNEAGLARWTAGEFTPHVTLLYDHSAVPSRAVDPITWTVDSFALVHSFSGQQIRLGAWALRA